MPPALPLTEGLRDPSLSTTVVRSNRRPAVARAIQQVRTLTGFSALTTATQSVLLEPGTVPDGSTVTRLVGSFQLEYLPAAGSAARALIVLGLAVTDSPGTVDVALPNSQPTIWLGWWYQPLMLNLRGSAGTTQVPTERVVDFDVHGQRITSETSGMQLRLFGRLVSTITAGTAAVRIGLTQFYKLPV